LNWLINPKFMILKTNNRLILFPILIFLAMSSCKINGNFSVIKRKYFDGYYLETPYVQENIKNDSTRVHNLKKRIKTTGISKINKITIPERAFSLDTMYSSKSLTEQWLASTDEYYFGKLRKIFFPPDTIKPLTRETTRSFIAVDSLKNMDVTKDYHSPSQKTNILALLAFILSLLLPILAILWLIVWFSSFSAPLILLIVTLALPIAVILLAFIGKKKIKKYPKFKGHGLAKTAIIFSFIFLFGIALVSILWLIFMATLNIHLDLGGI
jgi:hypothetical protein